MLWIDYFRERDTTFSETFDWLICCGLITLGNEIQPSNFSSSLLSRCGLITLGNEIQQAIYLNYQTKSCGLITLGNEIQLRLAFKGVSYVVD